MRSRRRPGCWSIVNRHPEYDRIRFDCCRDSLVVARDTCWEYRFCPLCGHRLTHQRATRPHGYPAWAWNRGLKIPTVKTVQRPTWFLESATYPARPDSWRTESRIYYDCPLRQLRDHIADLDPASLLTTIHFRLAYRRAGEGELIGTVSRPEWNVRPLDPYQDPWSKAGSNVDNNTERT
jgi:hypothetical protein